MMDEEVEMNATAAQEATAPDVVLEVAHDEVLFAAAAILKSTVEEGATPIKVLVNSRRELTKMKSVLTSQEEVRCANQNQGLWTFLRPETFDGRRVYKDKFWEVSMNLKGAESGCMGNGEEGRLGKILVEVLSALDRSPIQGGRVMVDVDPRRLGAGDEYNTKFAIGTNMCTEDLIDAMWNLNQVEAYGGLKHFKVDEMETETGTERKLWMLSPSGQLQTIWAEATWMMQAGVYVHGFGAEAFGPGGEGAAFVMHVLGKVRIPENGTSAIRELPGTVRVRVRFPMNMAVEVEAKIAHMTAQAGTRKQACKMGERRCTLVEDDLFCATKVFKEVHKGKTRDQGMGKGAEKIMQQMQEMQAEANEARAEATKEVQEAKLAAAQRAAEAAEATKRAEEERKEMNEAQATMATEAQAAAEKAELERKELAEKVANMADAVRTAEATAAQATSELDQKVSNMSEETVRLLMQKCAEMGMLQMGGVGQQTPQLQMTPTKEDSKRKKPKGTSPAPDVDDLNQPEPAGVPDDPMGGSGGMENDVEDLCTGSAVEEAGGQGRRGAGGRGRQRAAPILGGWHLRAIALVSCIVTVSPCVPSGNMSGTTSSVVEKTPTGLKAHTGQKMHPVAAVRYANHQKGSLVGVSSSELWGGTCTRDEEKKEEKTKTPLIPGPNVRTK